MLNKIDIIYSIYHIFFTILVVEESVFIMKLVRTQRNQNKYITVIEKLTN